MGPWPRKIGMVPTDCRPLFGTSKKSDTKKVRGKSIPFSILSYVAKNVTNPRHTCEYIVIGLDFHVAASASADDLSDISS